MLAASEQYFKNHGEPLFSSHMLDLSEEPLEENIETCKVYLERMAKVGARRESQNRLMGFRALSIPRELIARAITIAYLRPVAPTGGPCVC